MLAAVIRTAMVVGQHHHMVDNALLPGSVFLK